MPRLKLGQEAAADTLQQKISDRIKAGKVVPIISNALCNDLALGQGQHHKLVQAYAQQARYDPALLAGDLSLPQIAQYISVVHETVADAAGTRELYRDVYKSWLFDLAEGSGRLTADIRAELDEQFDQLSVTMLAEGLGLPAFAQGRHDPLLILADFRLPIYLTNSHHYYLELALERTGSQPRSAICPWREGLNPTPFYLDKTNARRPTPDPGHTPNNQQPLVYHLHGFDQIPDSLVLTEDDYLEFLVAISRDKGKQNPIPLFIREALDDSSLLLLGFNIRSWDFRALFWGLIKTEFRRRYKNVSVQLDPKEVDERYLQRYLAQADFEVYRGTIFDYLAELRRGWDG
jgi:hypothetical protein